MIIRTYTGRDVSLVAPSPSSIDIRDIACALARLNRFAGATRLPVNVACHSLNVARALGQARADAATQLLGLLHDAHEAYICDITGPVRRVLAILAGTDLVSVLAERLDRAIRGAFGLTTMATPSILERVQIADEAVMAAEWRDLMPGPCPVDVQPAPFAIKPRNADRAEEEFLRVFSRLRLEAGCPPAALGSTLSAGV